MPTKDRIPSYRLHKQSGQAVTTLTDGLGRRRDVLLGTFNTPESKTEYNRVIAEWLAAGRRLPGPSGRPETPSVHELALQYLLHAEAYYRHPDGTPTSEVGEIRLSLRPLCHLYGHTPAGDFGPLALKAVRDLMVRGYTHPEYGEQMPLCRRSVNLRVDRLKRVFKWAVSNELLPPSVLEGLRSLAGLRRNRSDARETEPVRPVSEAVVEKTLEVMPRQLAAMVEVQLLSGMRPGEVCIMRALDIDMTGPVWIYRPGSDQGAEGRHKTAHHGHQRVIPIGPKAQAILRPFLTLDVQAYLFSPRARMEDRSQELRSRRKSKVQPSQQNRRQRNPRRAPGDRYRVSSYEHAIRAACDKAFPPPKPLAREPEETKAEWLKRLETQGLLADLKAWQKAHRWHPHMLRHATATKLRREFGLDVARVVLGHRTPAVTEIYAEIDVTRATEAMAKIG